MVERPPLSGRIHKTTTSKIAFIGLAAATMIITVSIVGAVIQMQEASAAKPSLWCYLRDLGGGVSGFTCPGTRETCNDQQSTDSFASGRCRPSQSFH